MIKFISCPFCGAVVPENTLLCPVCDEDIRVAILVVSSPSPQIPMGQSWILGHKNYTVGRDTSCDIVLPDHAVPKIHFLLVYNDGKFKIKPLSGDFPDTGGKVDLKSIHAGHARLSLSYIKDDDLKNYNFNSGRAFRVALSASETIEHLSDLKEVAIAATDAAIKISGMEKGYFFNISFGENKDCAFEFLAARSATMTEFDSRFCPVSTQFCKKLFENKEKIRIIKPGSISPALLSSSVKRLNLQMILGIKIPDAEGNIKSIIYADTCHSYNAENFSDYRPAISIFTKFLTRKLLSLWKLSA